MTSHHAFQVDHDIIPIGRGGGGRGDYEAREKRLARAAEDFAKVRADLAVRSPEGACLRCVLFCCER